MNFVKKILKKIKAAIMKRLRPMIKYVNFKIVVPMYYKRCCKLPKNDKLVLFADLRSRPLHENFEGLYKMCEEKGYECVALDGRGYGEDVPKSAQRKARLKFQFDFLRYYAQCKALFLVEYFPLADAVKPREGTKVVQLWHGCGAMKRMGYAAGSKWGVSQKAMKRYPMHQYYDTVCVSSADVIDCYAEAFHVDPKIIKPLGMPRTDIYFDKEYISQAKAKLLEKFPKIGDRKVILFAPTFRGKSIKKSFYKMDDMDFRLLKRELGDKYAFVTKFHPLMAKGGLTDSMKVKGAGFVFDGTYDLTPEEALCAADVLISDFSSIAFEYLLLDRPIVSYIPDLDKYNSDRGMFFPYEETLPGPYAFDPEELLETLVNLEETFDVSTIKPYRDKFMSGCDGHCTERIFKEILGE